MSDHLDSFSNMQLINESFISELYLYYKSADKLH